MHINRLIALRTQRGESQAEVAAALNIDRSTYNKYEKGINDPTVERLCQLAKYFGVTPDYLLGIDDKSTDASQNEKELTELFGKLSKSDQEAILNLTRHMAEK